MNRKIMEALKYSGFTDYEAKIYVALLQKHPLNGNSISVESGVPNSKVYETLKRMKSKGIIFQVSEGSDNDRKKYIPLPYKDLLASLKEEFNENTKLLEEHFDDIAEKAENSWTELFHIEGYEPSIEVIRNLIKDARNEIILSCWTKEMNLLFTELLDAHKNRVNVTSIVFDDNNHVLPWRTFQHHSNKNAINRHENEFSCVIDQEKVVILDSKDQHAYAIVSSHQIMVNTTRNYIRHDIYVNRMLSDFKVQIEAYYGKNLNGLINDF